MERRFFAAILLSFVVLYAYQALFVPPSPTPPTASRTSSSAPSTQPSVTPQGPETKPGNPVAPAPAAVPTEGEAQERQVVVDTSTVQVVLTNRGGRVLRWRLKAFQDQAGNLVDLVPTDIPRIRPVRSS